MKTKISGLFPVGPHQNDGLKTGVFLVRSLQTRSRDLVCNRACRAFHGRRSAYPSMQPRSPSLLGGHAAGSGAASPPRRHFMSRIYFGCGWHRLQGGWRRLQATATRADRGGRGRLSKPSHGTRILLVGLPCAPPVSPQNLPRTVTPPPHLLTPRSSCGWRPSPTGSMTSPSSRSRAMRCVHGYLCMSVV